MRLGERLEWFGRLALLLFILASVAFLSAITAMRFAIQGREVSMPDLVGRKIGDAQAALQQKGLVMKVEDRVYNERPVDSVVRQSPPAGMQIKVGQRAHLVLSLGPQRVTIPPLEEKSLRAARIELLRGGLQIGEISSAYLPDYPTDTVLLQDPPPGTSDATSPHVNLLVSLGTRPPAYVMPELVGLPLLEAQHRLSAAGLRVAKITFEPVPGGAPSGTSESASGGTPLVAAPTTAHGNVISQTPPRGARIAASDAVTLEVAE
jgi:beta-lactam-binding protein with PASTA domain